MDLPVDDTERCREPSKENVNNSPEGEPESSPQPLPPPYRRGRRDNRECAHRGDPGDYYDRNRYPPLRERDYKGKRPSYTPPPPSYRDRRGGYSPSPSPPYWDRRGWHSPSPPPPYWDRRGGHSPSRRPYRDRRGGHSPSSPPYRYRRGGHSPSPPLPYWDHRGGHSSSHPPRRSPPCPPYKRSRRDEYQGRRRRGYGPGDRRYGYDYRETGGRLGYHVERPHGRFIARSLGGYLDMVAGRDGFANAVGARSNQREGLKSYKQFIQELEDDILPAEAEGRYQEYKSGYIEARKRAYFDAHKDEEWLKDKYHPTNLISVIERRNELARKLTKTFILDMQSGLLAIGPRITPASANKPGQSTEPNSVEAADDDGKRRWHDRGPTKDTDLLSAAPKVHQVSSEPRRVQIDIEQAQELVRKLYSEKGIEDNILLQSDNDTGSRDKSHGDTSVKSLEGTELLDTLLTYLWRIHGVDYYGMSETYEAKGLRHVRVEGEASNVTTNGAEWEKKLDTHWQGRLKGQDPLELMTAKEKIDATANEGLGPYVHEIKDGKYGCGVKGCTKFFHGAPFVHKHLKLKHPDLVMELTSKVREDLYFQNYMNDENAPGGTPIMQPSLPKVKDDRGNRRDRDGGERFDRSADSQSKKDGANEDKPGEHISGGQGIPVVPGAGILGPFIPARPEQGGTDGSSGAATNWPHRQDPHRLRSFPLKLRKLFFFGQKLPRS